jgi:hypothetical protein
MTAALLETVDDKLMVPEDNVLMAAEDDAMKAVEDNAPMVDYNPLMAAVKTSSVVVVFAIPMISLVQCQYFAVFLYCFGTVHI